MGLAEFDADFGEKKSSGAAAFDADFGGAAPKPDTRNALTRGYQAISEPVTKAASYVADKFTEPAVSVSRLLMGEPVSQVFGDMGPTRSQGNNPLAEVVVPQTPTEAGMMVGTMGAGAAASKLPSAVARLAKANPALTRILGGTAGGAGGDVAEGGSGVRGAVTGAAANTVGEGLGALLGRLRLAIPGGKRAANEADTRNIGDAVRTVAPDLASVIGPRPTVGTMREAVEGKGLDALGQGKERIVRQIEEGLAPGNHGLFIPGGEIPMPSVATREVIGTSRANPPSRPAPPPNVQEPPYPGMSVDTVYGATPRQTGTQPTTGPMPATGAEPYGPGPRSSVDTPITVGRSTMSLRQANAELSRIGDMLHGRRELDPRFKDVDLEQLYGRIAQDIERGIEQRAGPDAAAAWRSAQEGYRKGRSVLEVLNRANLVDADGFLNVPALQRALKVPEVASKLRDRLGDADFQTLANAVFRGSDRTAIDRITPGKGTSLDALMSLLRRQNTGSGALAGVATGVSELLPNLGSQYVGRNPLALPNTLRGIVDVGMQRGATRSE